MIETIIETRLIEWNKMKAEIAEAKDVIILGKLNYTLEAIQKWAKQSKQSLGTQNEIAEYRLRLNRKQGEWIEANIPEEGGKSPLPTENSRLSQPTLADAGIDRNDSPKFRILAKIPEAKFIDKLLSELKDNQQAILLTNNNTDTAFFHKAARIANALCFTKGRIHFYKAGDETLVNPTNGQVFYYFGPHTDRFIQVFSTFGLILMAYEY